MSQTRGREGESFASPVEQRQRIEAECERQDLKLLRAEDELDVSGGTSLANRTGLRSAVEAIESGSADVIVAAYFDRFFRDLGVQAEVVQRIEAAGGTVFAVDVGKVGEATAGEWLSGTMLGAVAEYHRRTTRERTRGAQVRAVARGVRPTPYIPPGYERRDDGVLQLSADAPVAVQAFEMRDNGATIGTIREHLRANGIELSFASVVRMLKNDVYLGRVKFGKGKMVNDHAHEPLIDAELFRRVQRQVVPCGRRAKSQRLLARQGVLVCGSCGSRMSQTTGASGDVAVYRCSPPNGDCEQRMTISADIADKVVSDRVRQALADKHGEASTDSDVQGAEAHLARTQEALDNAIRTLATMASEPAAVETLEALKSERDTAQERLDDLRSADAALTIGADQDWDVLTLDERRGLVSAVVAEARVRPGRGAERIAITLR